MKQLAAFMDTEAGRVVRGALGIALIGVGLAAIHGTAGVALAAIGLVPLALGAWGRCILQPFATQSAA